MKYAYIILAFLLSSLAYAEGTKDDQSVTVCTDLATAQNLNAEDAGAYVENCVKDIAEVEKEEAKKAATKS